MKSSFLLRPPHGFSPLQKIRTVIRVAIVLPAALLLIDAARAGYGDAIKQALSAARQGNIAAAERAVDDSSATANAAKAHLHTAQRLIMIAGEVARDGQKPTADRLAEAALRHLAQAERQAGNDQPTRISALTLSGYLYEHYLADLSSARASYEAAAALNGAKGQAREAADRLAKTEANKAANGGAQ